MELEELKIAIAEHGIKINFLKKSLYKILSGQIPNDAEIVMAIEGLDSRSANTIPVIATKDKIYMIKYAGGLQGISHATIDRSAVTGFDVSGGLLTTLTIHTTGTDYLVEKVGSPDALKFMAALS